MTRRLGGAAVVFAVAVVIPFVVAAQSDPRPRLTAETEARTRAEAAFTVAPLDCNSAPLLGCSSTRTASPSCLSGTTYLDLYTFSGTAGQTLTITATTATGYQMLVTVQSGTTGAILKSNYGPSPVTLTYTFPATATYFIGFGYIANYATGSYTLTLSCPAATCQYSGTLTIGSTLSGSLLLSDTACSSSSSYVMKVYKLVVAPGDAVSVTLQASFAPWLEIERLSDKHGWDVWGSSGPASWSYIATSADTLSVYVSHNTATPTTGTFTLSVQRDADAACRHRAAAH